MQEIKPWHKLSLLVIAIMVLLKFVLLPWQQWLLNNAEQIAYYKGLQSKLQNTQLRADTLKQQNEVIVADYQQLMTKLLPASSDNNIDVLRYVESKAKQYHLKINNRAVGDLQQAPLPALPITITLQGHPEMILAYLQDVETGTPKVVISNMSIIKPGLSVQFVNMRLDAIVLLAPAEGETAI
ncbi:hypothetical protein ORJ00_10155 [Rheinheimera baltica]|uniref:hypothetical protein n=2 Tax=Rheinheimera baltica TaxID=67576 RepID=UPI00273E31B6|nr:hypothetical protein [Rheinheimera baltica]MDP5143106.1 hypothetical protein [Rheinheimera baltica]